MRKCHPAAVWPGTVEWELCVALIAEVKGCLMRHQWAYCKKYLEPWVRRHCLGYFKLISLDHS